MEVAEAVEAVVTTVVVATDGASDEVIKEEADDNEVATEVGGGLNGSTTPMGDILGKPGGLPRPANKELGPPIFGCSLPWNLQDKLDI